MMKYVVPALLLSLFVPQFALAQDEQQLQVVRPKEIDDVLTNPGIGFTTFHRFNGDRKRRDGADYRYPESSITYFRPDWAVMEPEDGKFNWQYLDGLLKTARERNQTLMLRINPHDYNLRDEPRGQSDVPAWYRKMVGNDYEKLPVRKWSTDPEDPRYVKYYGRFIRALGARYDGHPDLEGVDLAIVGAWGEGAGAERLTDATAFALVDAYTDAFKKTPLITLLMDARTNKYALSKGALGWRADCLGDMGGFQPNWSHMQDRYPQAVINNGLADAWKHGPVSFEACWVMEKWEEEGWDVDYIVEQSLKWHISSFNAKSSSVPERHMPAVNRWLKRMGYRFVLRKFTFPAEVSAGGKLKFGSWWENKGVAPIYKPYRLAVRLSGQGQSQVLVTDADIRTWLPGDAVYDGALDVPTLPAGEYDLSIAILDPTENVAKVKLAIDGRQEDGWYPLGRIRVTD